MVRCRVHCLWFLLFLQHVDNVRYGCLHTNMSQEAAKRYQWWNDDWMTQDFERERQEVITIFGRDGSMTSIPPFIPCYDVCGSENQWENHGGLQSSGNKQQVAALPSTEEQGICVGSVFSISATNGYDVSRRIHVSGFCQSIDFLFEQVEGSVRVRGGEVMNVKRELSGSDMLCESLTLALALPLLWHIPPEHEKLKKGIERGGGIIHKIYNEWFIL